MVLQAQSGMERIQEQFDELCRNILSEELTDNGRCLRRKGLHTMKLTLSPMETRHETAIRVIVAQIGCLGMRIKRLEEGTATPSEPASTDKADPLPTDTEQMFVEAIPPAYAEHIGRYAMMALEHEKPLTEE